MLCALLKPRRFLPRMPVQFAHDTDQLNLPEAGKTTCGLLLSKV